MLSLTLRAMLFAMAGASGLWYHGPARGAEAFMIEVVYYVASSLDGYIADADGGVEWLSVYQGGQEDYGYADFYSSVQAVVMGRVTFSQALGFGAWPYAGKQSWVFSHRALAALPRDVTVTARAPADVLAEIETGGIRRVWLVGGGDLAASFRRDGLISEYIVSIIPVLLGSGVPLFGSPGPQEQMTLAGCRSYGNGLVQLRYLPLDEA